MAHTVSRTPDTMSTIHDTLASSERLMLAGTAPLVREPLWAAPASHAARASGKRARSGRCDAFPRVRDRRRWDALIAPWVHGRIRRTRTLRHAQGVGSGPLACRAEGNLQALVEYLSWARGQRFAAARYIPRTGDAEEFEAFCRIAYGFRNAVIVVEEVAAICQASYLPPEFGKIVRMGRHRGLGLLWCTQRLNEVSRTLTSLTDVWAGFSLSEPADLMALAQRCGRHYAEQVAKLSRFEWLGYNVDDQATFTEKSRLLGLWGAPPVWANEKHKVITPINATAKAQ